MGKPLARYFQLGYCYSVWSGPGFPEEWTGSPRPGVNHPKIVPESPNLPRIVWERDAKVSRASRYDIHRIQNIQLAVHRESFDQVTDLAGYQLRPTAEPFLWDFQHNRSGNKGKLLHVEGFLGGSSIALQPHGQAYLVAMKGKTLGLLFPGVPKRMKLIPSHYRAIALEKYKGLPQDWPREIAEKILRVRMRELIFLNEFFLLDIAQQKTPAA